MGGLIGSNQHSKRLSAVVLEGHFGRQFQNRRQPAALQKVVAEEAVISELVSARWFPCSTEISGKFADFGLEIAKAASAVGRKFNRLLIEFPSRLNRESLRAIREPGAGNSEPYPNNGARCLAPYHLRPQVQILG